MVELKRDKEVIAEVEVTNLKRGPQDVKEVLEGEMCGMSLKTSTKVDLQIDDRIEVYTRESIDRKIIDNIIQNFLVLLEYSKYRLINMFKLDDELLKELGLNRFTS